jgi:hypothetical protein
VKHFYTNIFFASVLLFSSCSFLAHRLAVVNGNLKFCVKKPSNVFGILIELCAGGKESKGNIHKEIDAKLFDFNSL